MTTAAATAVEFGDPRMPITFWQKVRIQKNGCWRWTVAVNSRGYSSAWDAVERRTESGHRLIYLRLIGDLPEGMTVDHQCHNDDLFCPGGTGCPHRRCVNPAHLDAVTYGVNNRRAWRPWVCDVRTTRCRQGHRLAPTKKLRGTRTCRRCFNEARSSHDSSRLSDGLASAAMPPGSTSDTT